MIRVLGGPKQLCDGVTRRDLLHVGSLSALGLGLGQVESLLGAGAARAASPAAFSAVGRFGQAKSCILLYLYGAPSQIETFDPKPNAPEAIRGELNSIPSNVPGLDVCELLPHLSQVMDKVSVIRSVSHPNPVHGVAYATTGTPQITIPMELNPRDPAHWPFIGSVIDHVEQTKRKADGTSGGRSDVPRNLVLPWAFSSHRVGEVARAGPYGGFLGAAWDPTFCEFVGQGTHTARKTLTDKVWEDFELYRGITPDSRFRLGAVGDLQPGLTLDRLDQRRTLLQQLEASRAEIDRGATATGVDRQRALAYNLFGSDRFRRAFDLGDENSSTRELYGMTLFGQASLTARRLVEAGGRFLTVFWDEYGLAGTGWDTHWDHFPRMKDELLPGLDRTLSGLLIDLDRRGMLDETLVVCLSEHGRTPKLATNVKGGGRDHWSRCYSVVLAGGGVKRGNVLGRSDAIASDPVERRVSPKDILATIYHLMGIDPATELTDQQGRPMPLVPGGQVIPEIIA